MSDLSTPNLHALESERLAALRGRAASRLAGAAATKGSPARAADALSVLHHLASSPATASDALTLLHELQVLQVELDLQALELRESRAELESELRRQMALYDFQPVGCFSIDAHRVLHELNQTGADMLGVRRADACGMPVDTFFCDDSARRFASALASVAAGTRRTSCLLTLRPKGGPERAVVASVGADPAGQGYLLTLADAGPGQERLPDGP
jgi:PAS domain-containing protein